MGKEIDLHRKFIAKVKLTFALFTVLVLYSLYHAAEIVLSTEDKLVHSIRNKYNNVFTIHIPLYRGSIKDFNGRDIAISVPTISVYVHPNTKLIKNKQDFTNGLSEITGIDIKKIRARLSIGSDKPIKILSGIEMGLKDKIRLLIRRTQNSNLIGIQEEFTRLYPNGSLASNVVGFVGVDGKGLDGMEYKLNQYLKGGYAKALIYISNFMGQIYLNPIVGYIGNSNDVKLTLDVGIQHIIERIRDSIVRKWRPKKVSIILLDVSNGHILGLTTYPYFDPNRFQDYSADKRRNFAVTDIFEPGSIMKPFFIAWAMEKGYVDRHRWINTGNGRIKVYDRYVRDSKRLGTLILRDVLVFSSNVGTIQVAMHLKKEDVEELLESFHMHKRFGIFPGEANPWIPDMNYPANILYSSIGQGIAMNTLNIAVAFGGLATGKVVTPHIVKEVISSDGEVIYSAQTEVWREEVLSEKTLHWLHNALIKVVEKGTGKKARSRYFTIAGKTGTSQKWDKELGRYSRYKVVTYFAGFFPATDPRFVAVIVVDEPKGDRGRLYGGIVAAPYFKELAEQVGFYYGLKPDKLKK